MFVYLCTIYIILQSIKTIDLHLDLGTGLSHVVWKTSNFQCCKSPRFTIQILFKGMLKNDATCH